jgi:peroxiredoxin/mono/diheme cytochrome c family protein
MLLWSATLVAVVAAGAAVVGGRAALPAGTPPPTETTTAEQTVDDFTLRDVHGRPHALGDWADRRAVVVVFLGTDCPLSALYGPRLAELAGEFGPRGVAFVGVNANQQDTLSDVAAYARRHDISFPILKDLDGTVAARLGADRTPEAFVLDPQRVVRYRGRIDDQYGVGVRRPAPTRRDLADALDDLLAGRPVARPAVPAVGCRIGCTPPPAPASGGEDVTYTRQVSRILQRRCVECHRAGEAAPFPLTAFADAAAWAPMIREVVEGGRMPPWFADPAYGRFRNDPRLSDDERRLLFAWIDAGCPEGDPADRPPPPAFADGWRIPRPDRVLDMANRPFDVPAEGTLPYQYFEVDPGFTEDVYLRAMEVRPGNPAVVHHALVLIEPPGGQGPALDSVGAMIDYAPGMAPMVLPEGTALRVPAGSRFLFQMHYTPNGSPQQDRTRLGLVFADPKTVRRCVQGGAVVNRDIALPAGAADYRLTAEYFVPRDALLVSLSPHMHLRGKAFRFEAAYPDGRREVLLDVPHYDFNWQLRYELAEPKPLPAGTRLVCTARYDNSAANPANPDPGKDVGWGDQTDEEMLIGFFAFVPVDGAGE